MKAERKSFLPSLSRETGLELGRRSIDLPEVITPLLWWSVKFAR
jgi:hypothetical protein